MKMFYRLASLLKRISLIDKCLLIFMTIFMIQIIFNLFVNEVGSENQNLIDVIIRTSAAAIFGYFISNNNLISKNNQTDLSKNINNNSDEFRSDESIFNNNSKEEKVLQEHKNEDKSKNEIRDERIIIITVLGVISLLALIIVRNFFDLNSTATASITELRDFISNAIGFLLGYQKKKNE